jgi:benzoyl-CoA reductase/2-hydroxyglutaryl-CoA dehydratase subunit BcrC/BadD/HgdB
MSIGYACAYTPLALLNASGFPAYRILPVGPSGEQASRIVHDNMCPHVKRILDRGLAPDLPALEGVVFVNSCDAMRRLSDAWAQARPGDRRFLLDLPATADGRPIAYYAEEISRLRDALSSWTGRTITDEAILASIGQLDEIANLVAAFRERLQRGTLPASRMQAIMNEVSTAPPGEALSTLRALLSEPGQRPSAGVPVLVFGNVMPDPETFELIESCGARIVEDDVCTGSRLLARTDVSPGEDPVLALSRSLLSRAPCARTITASRPGRLAADVLEARRRSGARGVIAHVLKFCDPYLARLPAVHEALGRQNVPLLVLEGDLTLRSIGQHRTRIEAFVEMLS